MWIFSSPIIYLHSMTPYTDICKKGPRYFSLFVMLFAVVSFLYVLLVLLLAHSYACVCGALSRRWMAA